MSDTPFSHPLRVADLAARKPTRFDITPDAATLTAMARQLGADSLRKVRLKGELRPFGRRDWELEATLGATAVQACIATLEPVTTRIDEPVTRRWLSELPEPSGDEAEMPEDDTLEKLGPVIDLGTVLTEALALALPLYPRKTDAAPREEAFTEPGKAPLTDEAVRPFAGLGALRDRLAAAQDDTAGDDDTPPDPGRKPH